MRILLILVMLAGSGWILPGASMGPVSLPCGRPGLGWLSGPNTGRLSAPPIISCQGFGASPAPGQRSALARHPPQLLSGNAPRVLSWIGSYTALQRSAAHPKAAVRPNPGSPHSKRNIRVRLQDGSGDLDNAAGDSPAANIGMAKALKFKGYDYHFPFGVGEHNNAHGTAESPEALTWLWRDYDPAKKSQDFVQEAAEEISRSGGWSS